MPIARSTTDSRTRTFLHALEFALIAVLLTACGGPDEGASDAADTADSNPNAALQLVTSTSDLADLTQQIAGEAANVASLIEAGKDPHTVEVRPNMARMLRDADALLIVGRGNEAHWLGELIDLAGRTDLTPGQPKLIDASATLTDPSAEEHESTDTATADAPAAGDHPEGDPHYLLDPVNGLIVARHIHDRLAGLYPDHAGVFASNLAAFESQLIAKLIGAKLAATVDAPTLIATLAFDSPQDNNIINSPDLAGWLGAMKPHRGTAFIGDHEVWDAFAARFGLRVAGYLEPAPGLDPTTQHLTQLTRLIGTENIPLILSCSHVPQKHARFLTDNTNAKLLLLADQVGESEDAPHYIALFDHNIAKLIEALKN